MARENEGGGIHSNTTGQRNGGLWRGALAAMGIAVVLQCANMARADLVFAWGYNADGELGNGTTITSSTPVAVSGLGSGVAAMAEGDSFSMAIQNGALYVWGAPDFYGDLGNGTTTGSTTPVAVSALASGVTAVAGGYEHALAIRNGAVYAWGYNLNGELGNGTEDTNPHPTPVAVSGLTSSVTAVAAGEAHNLAIQNGAAYAWGANENGELGNGTSVISSSTPVAVSGLASGVTAVAAGMIHSLAIQNGAAYAWGNNAFGQLGNGTITSSRTPVAVSGLTSGVTAVAAGRNFSLAVQNGIAYDWGNNQSGELGNDTVSETNPLPVQVLGLPHDIVQVAASDASSFALEQNGTLWTWGGSVGTALDNNKPVMVPAPLPGYVWTSIAPGDLASGFVLATAAPAPEPGSLALLAGASAALLLRRRRLTRAA